MTEPVLSIKGLRVEASTRDVKHARRWQTIVADIALTLDRGEVLGLIGESGAGKSTIGLAAMGYARRGCRITHGDILLNGVDLRTAQSAVLHDVRGRRVAYVAQSAAAAFNPAHKIMDQVLEVSRIHGELNSRIARERAVRLFSRMMLPNPQTFGDRYVHEVSGGQLQRAMTAMALAGDPDLIVFDEPTTALDVTTQIEVLAIIREAVREAGTAALYITHDLAVVAQIADRIKVLRDGCEVEEQPTLALLQTPKNTYTRALLDARGRAVQREPGEATAVLLARGIYAGYARKAVLHDVDLTVRSGRNLAIVGESGSGKSTLARVICGLLPPFSGKLTFESTPIAHKLSERTQEMRRRIQLIYQNPDVAMNPRHTVAKIISRPVSVLLGANTQTAATRAAELLDLVDLPRDLLQRYPGQLSGGQKQRVCIARALAAAPDLVICDEVTSALDPLVADGIVQLLMRLQRDLGVSYVFITHDFALVRAVADEIVVLKDGHVVEAGTRETILTPPHADYTEQLITSTPQMDVAWLDTVLATRRTPSAKAERA